MLLLDRVQFPCHSKFCHHLTDLMLSLCSQLSSKSGAIVLLTLAFKNSSSSRLSFLLLASFVRRCRLQLDSGHLGLRRHCLGHSAHHVRDQRVVVRDA